jgi:tRNA threonylcarbamoyladenosine biosynthesis protein TsaB
MPPAALVLDENSFAALLKENEIIFFGNGAVKWGKICKNANASFSIVADTTLAMAQLSNIAFSQNKFASLAYTEPLYLKEFQNNI